MDYLKKPLSYWKYGLAFMSPFAFYGAYKFEVNEPKNKIIALDEQTAIDRSVNIYDIKYSLFLNLSKPDDDLYRGKVTIQFKLKKISEGIFLDFKGKINSLILNNKSHKSFHKVYNRIHLNVDYLLTDTNVIVIEFESKFSNIKSKGIINTVNEYLI